MSLLKDDIMAPSNLPKAPPALYFYGLTGSGKSYVGDLLGKAGWRVYHADSDLTPEMKEAIQKKQLFTPEMRNEFYQVVANRIIELLAHGSRLVITQATYKREHRALLQRRIPSMALICVTASPARIAERLKSRGDLITQEYAAQIAKNFEPPLPGELVLANSGGDTEILRQLEAWYA